MKNMKKEDFFFLYLFVPVETIGGQVKCQENDLGMAVQGQP